MNKFSLFTLAAIFALTVSPPVGNAKAAKKKGRKLSSVNCESFNMKQCEKHSECEWWVRPQQGDIGSVCVAREKIDCESLDMAQCEKHSECEWWVRPQQGDIGSVCVTKE